MLMLKEPMDPNFEPLRSMGSMALSIRNFVLNQAKLIISHTCQLTNNQKMCSLHPWYMEFPIYLVKCCMGL
jgi:hypothetical protein